MVGEFAAGVGRVVGDAVAPAAVAAEPAGVGEAGGDVRGPDVLWVEGTDSALSVGDSGSDVLSAHRAGLDSAFVRRQHAREVELPVEPTHEVETLDGVAALLD